MSYLLVALRLAKDFGNDGCLLKTEMTFSSITIVSIYYFKIRIVN